MKNRHFRKVLKKVPKQNFKLRALFFFGFALFCCSTVTTKRRRCTFPTESDTLVSHSKQKESEERKLSLVVLTHSRAESLVRLLDSLNNAFYDGDVVDLHVWIDRSKEGTVDDTTIQRSSEFPWMHGSRFVHVWDKHVGIWGQWIDSCRGEVQCLILEDDLQVSPQYYRWLTQSTKIFKNRTNVFGFTLQRGTLRANRTGFGRRPLKIPSSVHTFMYPLLGSWGYSPVPGHWERFREWFHSKACDPQFHPYVEDLVPTLWYKKQERRRSMWTMWHIRYAHDNELFTVYANLPEERTLAASWREPGLHFRLKTNASDNTDSAKLAGKLDFALLESDRMFPQIDENPPKFNWNGLRTNTFF